MHILREIAIEETPRVMQIRGMFDLQTEKTSRLEWDVHLDLPAQWNIGVIVGPSGCGKTTIAQELFRANLISHFQWAEDKSIVDCFPINCGIKEVVSLLSSVGFNSPPSWLRPFRVLSNGEQFRVIVARALAEQKDLVVLDEFTSVVDRNVAQIGSAAVAKSVRRRNQKLIAVSCHYDILPWLEPDWVYEPATDTLTIGRLLRRPEIKLEIFRVHYAAWQIFRKHHYLDTNLSRSAACFLAQWNEVPVAFSSWLPLVSGSVTNAYREHRTVTLPDFQGVGIGNALSAFCASAYRGVDRRAFSTTSHPAMISARARNKNWRLTRAPSITAKDGNAKFIHARTRFTAGFEYVGPAMNRAQALEFLAN